MECTTRLLSPHLVRLSVPRPRGFHWKAGQSAYLILPHVSTLPWEAHPFTIASYDVPRVAPSDQEKGPIQDADELMFLINVRGGFTKKLGAVAKDGGKVKVLVDGPYGLTPDLKPFGTVALIAGGSGVSYTLPIFCNTIECVARILSVEIEINDVALGESDRVGVTAIGCISYGLYVITVRYYH